MASEGSPEIPPGLVAGKYRLTRLLGRGGMGAVFEGVHEALGTRVAVKFIDTEHAGSEDVRQRFVNEAKAAARLRSKHVVQVYDQGVGEDGRPYIVMEFLAGEPLDARIDRLGTLSPGETARIVLHVCRALSKAHEGGIVHRDLKPENVFIVHDEEDRTDVAKVVDFGIAKFTDAGGAGSSSTRTGAVLGTPQYMSPEQARGLRTVDHRTDLWSLGVIVYLCLVGRLPFKGEAIGDLLVNVCTADPPAPSSVNPSVPPGFDAWVRRALAREPAERFQSAGELCDSLAEVCGVDIRLGAVSSRSDGVTRVELPAPGGSSRAVTEGSFTSPKVAGESRSPSRPLLVALGALFLLVLGAAVVGARALFLAEPEPPRALALPSSSVPARLPATEPSEVPAPAPTVSPEVSPLPAGAAAPSASGAARPARPARPGAGKGSAGAAAPSKGVRPAQPGPGAAPARTTSPGASKPDLLGY